MQADKLTGCTCNDETTRTCPVHSPLKYKQNDPPTPSSNTPQSVHDSNRSDETTTLSSILQERGSRYGNFTTHAEITQKLKEVVYLYSDNLKAIHQEALDMIMHKVGRILNGDPNYADSWVDIAGYAQLVVDRLPKER